MTDRNRTEWNYAEKVSLSLTNKTPYEASACIFAETSKQAARPLGYTAFVKWPKVSVKSGESKVVRIANNSQNSF